MLIEVETPSRWDALALARHLDRYRWYLVTPDSSHWDVRIQLAGEDPLPDALRETIARWLEARGREAATVYADGRSYNVERSSSGT